MRTTDILGHRLPNHRVPSDKRIVVVEDDFNGIFEPCNLHGKLYSSYLDAFDPRRSESLKRTRRALFFNNDNIYWRGRCLGGPLLTRQKPGPNEWIGRNKTQAHENTPLADRLLKSVDRYRHIPHSGWNRHQLANAGVTASLHLGARRDGVAFTPPDAITDDLSVVVPFVTPEGKEYNSHRLVPDYLLGLGRYFAVETDLGNETGEPREEVFHEKKSLMRMVLQYFEFIAAKQDVEGTKLYNIHYRIPRNKALLVLFVTTRLSTLNLLERIILKLTDGHGCNFILMQYLDAELIDPYQSPQPIYTLWTGPWKRAGRSDFYINNPARQ